MKDQAARASGPLYFNVLQEAQKVRNLVKANPPAYPTRCNAEDLQQLPYVPNDLGFFVVLLPGQLTNQRNNFNFMAEQGQASQARDVLSRLNVQALDSGLLVASTACSWHIAQQRVFECECLCYMAIAFSTPHQLQVLAEDPRYFR